MHKVDYLSQEISRKGADRSALAAFAPVDPAAFGSKRLGGTNFYQDNNGAPAGTRVLTREACPPQAIALRRQNGMLRDGDSLKWQTKCLSTRATRRKPALSS